MAGMDGMLRVLDGDGEPARVRVRAAVLAAVARPGGCAPAALADRVAANLGRPVTQELRRRVDGALGLLIVRGAVDEMGGLLFLTSGASRAAG